MPYKLHFITILLQIIREKTFGTIKQKPLEVKLNEKKMDSFSTKITFFFVSYH